MDERSLTKGDEEKHTERDQNFATEATEFKVEVNIYKMGVAYQYKLTKDPLPLLSSSIL